MDSATKTLLQIGLDSWIIQDGNYPDFSVGQRAKFALEFYPMEEMQTVPKGALSAEYLRTSCYRIRARVLFSEDGLWAIDAGAFLAYQEFSAVKKMAVGSYVEGEICLGIDPFFYFEGLHSVPGMPALSYQWMVREIKLSATPWIEGKDPSGRTIQYRDESREAWVAVKATDAWHDDGGIAGYLLGCELVGGPEPVNVPPR